MFAKYLDGPLLGRADSPGIFVCILNQLSIQNRLQLPPRGKQLQDTYFPAKPARGTSEAAELLPSDAAGSGCVAGLRPTSSAHAVSG